MSTLRDELKRLISQRSPILSSAAELRRHLKQALPLASDSELRAVSAAAAVNMMQLVPPPPGPSKPVTADQLSKLGELVKQVYLATDLNESQARYSVEFWATAMGYQSLRISPVQVPAKAVPAPAAPAVRVPAAPPTPTPPPPAPFPQQAYGAGNPTIGRQPGLVPPPAPTFGPPPSAPGQTIGAVPNYTAPPPAGQYYAPPGQTIGAPPYGTQSNGTYPVGATTGQGSKDATKWLIPLILVGIVWYMTQKDEPPPRQRASAQPATSAPASTPAPQTGSTPSSGQGGASPSQPVGSSSGSSAAASRNLTALISEAMRGMFATCLDIQDKDTNKSLAFSQDYVSALGLVLKPGTSQSYNLPVSYNERYVIVARGDDDAKSISIQVRDQNNNTVSTETGKGACALSFSPTGTGTYQYAISLNDASDVSFVGVGIMGTGPGYRLNKDLINGCLSNYESSLSNLDEALKKKNLQLSWLSRPGVLMFGCLLKQGDSRTVGGFSLPQGTTIALSIPDTSAEDTDLEILDNKGSQIAKDTDSSPAAICIFNNGNNSQSVERIKVTSTRVRNSGACYSLTGLLTTK